MAILALPLAAAPSNPVLETSVIATNPFPPALFDRPWQRKALVTGRGDPFRIHGALTHPERARRTFLRAVGNPENDPAKGWTCEMSWDLMVELGMNPTNTPLEKLFRYIGTHHLGYRIVINNVANGQSSPIWDLATANGMMPFAAHYNNTRHYRFNDPIGIKSAVSVGGGGPAGNVFSYGQSLEFHDALPIGWHGNTTAEDPAESWANQLVAAKFARVLDAHPEYNIWDAREYLHQAANHWEAGWTEKEGYGWVDEKAVVKKLQPAPPVSFKAVLSHDHHSVVFSWQNFLMSDFAATVIAKKNGPVIYEGAGTHFVWPSDRSGAVTFSYWSKNQAGERSRHESYMQRTIQGLLSPQQNYSAVVFGPPMNNDSLSESSRQKFLQVATNWTCDLVLSTSNTYYRSFTNFPAGAIVGVQPDYAAMVDYAIARNYRVAIVPMLPFLRVDLARFDQAWKRAADAGLLVVIPHEIFLDFTRRERRLTPSRLGPAVCVGPDLPKDQRASGSGLEFVDETSRGSVFGGTNDVNQAVALVAAKLAFLLETHPEYNVWDARQHLRELSSHYLKGWEEDGGYGRPPPGLPGPVTRLELAPPLRFDAARSQDGGRVHFSWEAFPQSAYAEVVLRRVGGGVLYHGAGTHFDWSTDVSGEATFTLQSRSKNGALSQIESYCRIKVNGLAPAKTSPL